VTMARIEDDIAAPVRAFDVWPGCSHTSTRAEELLVASPPFQRLRRLRQMGLAFHAWPNAENTRATHSLGVAAWSTAYLDALSRSADAATQAALEEAASSLQGLSLDVTLRLFSLLHDIDLLPLGHTLRYQSGLFLEGPGHPRLSTCVAGIKRSAAGTPGFDAFERHLDAAAAALAGEPSTHGRLMTEIVNSGLGTDLVDFALRDSFAITRAQARHDQLVASLRLVRTDDGWRLAFDAGDLAAAPALVAVADDLYLARYEVFAASVFHPVKLAADAMLDLVLRRLGPEACQALLPEDRLLGMGDDELMAVLSPAEAAVAHRLCVDPVGEALQAGRLHEEVWRTDDLEAFRTRPGAEQALALDPKWRSAAERSLRAILPWAEPGDVIVAVSPPAMQAKPANARFAGPEGGVFTLAEAPAHGFAVQAAETAASYGRLWSLRVYLAPRARHETDATAAAAAALFGA